MSTAATPTNARVRSINIGTSPEIDPQLKKKARDFYLANLTTNASKKEAETARKDLYKDMKDGKISSFSFGTVGATGAPVTLEVTIGTPSTDKMDLRKLIELVGLEAALDIATVTKGAVEETFGEKVAQQISTSVLGNENVSVKPAK